MSIQPFDKYLTRVLGLFVFLAFLSPVFFWPTFYAPFSSLTLISFFFFVEIALPCYLLLLSQKKHPFEVFHHPIIRALALLTLVMILSSLVGVDSLNSFLGTIDRPVSVLVYIHGFLLLLYTLELFSRNERWKTRIYLLIISMASVIALYTFGEGWLWPTFVTFEGRTASLLGSPNYLASFLILPTFLCMAHASNVQKKMRPIFWMLALTMVIAIVLSGTRGALLGLIVGALALRGFTFRLGTRVSKRMLLAGLLTFLGVFLVFSVTNVNSLMERFTQTTDANSSMRLVYWNMAVEGWKEHPFLGVGPGNFYAIADPAFTPDLYQHTHAWPDSPHSTLFERLSTTGLFGLFAWFLFLFFLMRALWQHRTQPANMALLAGIIAYLVQGLFFFDGISDFILFLFVIAWACTSTPSTTPHEHQSPSFLLGGIGGVLALTGIFFLVLPLRTEVALAGKQLLPQQQIIIDDLLISQTAFERATTLNTTQDPAHVQEAIDLYVESLERHPLRQQAWNDLAWLYYIQALLQQTIVSEEGILSAQRAIQLAPGRKEATSTLTQMLLHTATIASEQQQYPLLIQTYLSLIELQPTTYSYLANLATSYALNGQIEEAITTANTLKHLDPQSTESVNAFLESL